MGYFRDKALEDCEVKFYSDKTKTLKKETYDIKDIMEAMKTIGIPMKPSPPEPEPVPRFFWEDVIEAPATVQIPVEKFTELLEHIKSLEQRVLSAEKRLDEIEMYCTS